MIHYRASSSDIQAFGSYIMATESVYHFEDSDNGEGACGGADDSAVFSGDFARSLQKHIDCLSNSLSSLSEERDKLLEDRRSDRSKIIELSAELFVKESQVEKINQIETSICELHKNVHKLEENTANRQQTTEAEKTSLKRELADKVVIMQCLQLNAAKEKKILLEQNEELRKEILNYEKSNTNLKQEISNKICLLVEWKNKFELLKEENKRLVQENRRLSSGSSHPTPDLVECFSCKQRFNPEDTHENECRYHPLPPMGYVQWLLWPVAGKVDKQRYHKYHYYACCNTLSKQRPIGCVTGRHHTNWNINLCAVFQENDRFMENDDQCPIIIDN